jgi:hypothetical protein
VGFLGAHAERGSSTELGVEIVEEAPPDVDDQHGFGLAEKFLVRVGDARVVPDRQQGIQDAGAGVQDLPDVLGARTKVGELGVFRLDLPAPGRRVCAVTHSLEIAV